MMLMNKTYYEVLNLSEDASSEEIKQAYRSLIKQWHPDLNPDKTDAAAREERAQKLGGIDSTAEADKWFDVWLYPGMPVSDCRKAFFAFSVRADKHILSRFNMLSDEEKEEYADIIELLKECINYREKK